jgi:hypothetical protein
MTETEVDDILRDLKTQIYGKKLYGSVSFKKALKSDGRFAMLYFSPVAWAKITTLVARFTTEVQWHGLVNRISEQEFEVYDIIVPPHEVTGSTVTSDQEKYNEWLNNLDDETFNCLRFHGHSHVNMSVSPSHVDEKYRMDITTQLPKPTEGEDSFYIFLIINKSHEWSAEIYDITNNALYETDDIDIDVIIDADGGTLGEFLCQAKKLAVQRQPTYPQYSSYQPGIGWGGTSGKSGDCKSDAGSKDTKKDKKKEKDKEKQQSAKYNGYDSWGGYYRDTYGSYDDDYSGFGG